MGASAPPTQSNSEPIERLNRKPLDPGVPPVVILPAQLGGDSDKIRQALSEAHILLTDFGVSFEPSITQRYHYNAPAAVRPTEALFTQEGAEPLSISGCLHALCFT